jgi:hypothetical protein
MKSTGRSQAFAGIERELGTKWLRDTHRQLVDAGETDLSFRAWAAEMGIVVSSDSQWDDYRRRSLMSLDALMERKDDRAPFDETRLSPITPPGEGRRRRR